LREALETALIAFEGTVIAVSHDRYFIDRIGTRAIVLSPESENGALNYVPYEDESVYACYLRHKNEQKEIAVQTAEEKPKSESKQAYEQEKQRKNDERNQKRKKEKAEARIPLLEAELEKCKAELFGDAASDYLRAATLEEKIEAMEEELLSLYELTME